MKKAAGLSERYIADIWQRGLLYGRQLVTEDEAVLMKHPWYRREKERETLAKLSGPDRWKWVMSQAASRAKKRTHHKQAERQDEPTTQEQERAG